jgi:hypothetical protein
MKYRLCYRGAFATPSIFNDYSLHGVSERIVIRIDANKALFNHSMV